QTFLRSSNQFLILNEVVIRPGQALAGPCNVCVPFFDATIKAPRAVPNPGMLARYAVERSDDIGAAPNEMDEANTGYVRFDFIHEPNMIRRLLQPPILPLFER